MTRGRGVPAAGTSGDRPGPRVAAIAPRNVLIWLCFQAAEDGYSTDTTQYYVYIMTNNSGTLYTGVTNDLVRRVYEHKHKLVPGFTRRYNISRLVYFESTSDVQAALTREKQIKGWARARKLALIESANPMGRDLSEGWYEGSAASSGR